VEQQERTHRCDVSDLGNRWIVECPRCGQVGPPQEYELDALAIAQRHEDVGGFEPRS
jgi:hypothetical protein